MWNVHIVPSHLCCHWFGILKQLLMLHIIYSKKVRSPANALHVMGSFQSFNRRCFGVSRNWRWGGRSCWEQVSKTHPGLSLARENAAAGRHSGIKWLNAFSWWQQMGSFGPLEANKSSWGHFIIVSVPSPSPFSSLFHALICTKERRALASQLPYYATIKPFKDYFVCCFSFRMGSEHRYSAGFFLRRVRQ